MAAQWIDKQGPVIGCNLYVDSALVAQEVDVTLPTITPMTADLKAMGTWTPAIWGRLESLEAGVTKIGIDDGYISMISPEQIQLEARWVADKITADGQTVVGMKAFMTGTLKDIPGHTINVGSQLSSELKFELTRYELYEDNKEVVLVDRKTQQLKINGKDYYSDIASLL